MRPTTRLNKLVQVPSDVCRRDSGSKPKDSHQKVEVNWGEVLSPRKCQVYQGLWPLSKVFTCLPYFPFYVECLSTL